jgi:hypothetical protein
VRLETRRAICFPIDAPNQPGRTHQPFRARAENADPLPASRLTGALRPPSAAHFTPALGAKDNLAFGPPQRSQPTRVRGITVPVEGGQPTAGDHPMSGSNGGFNRSTRQPVVIPPQSSGPQKWNFLVRFPEEVP